MSYFNIRAYGLLLNERNELLLSDEKGYGMSFTKFPGGGIELGEGLRDGLKREFVEECMLEVEIVRHLYTTEEFIPSAFDESQVIAVYFLVHAMNLADWDIRVPDRKISKDEAIQEQTFRWVPLNELQDEMLTFEMDRRALEALRLSLYI